MTNEKVLSGLRSCVKIECEECPFYDGDPASVACGSEMMNAAAELIEKLTDRCARYAEEIAVLQEREKWVPVTERLPEVWRNDETSELVNYMIYSPDFGVDIGNYHAKARKWLCMALPCTVTHWRPLPDGPEMK